MKNFKKIIFVLATTVFLNSCQQEIQLENVAIQTTTDNAIAEAEFNEVVPAINERGIRDKGVKGCSSCGLTTGKLSGITDDEDTSYTTSEGIEVQSKTFTNNGILSKIEFTLTFNTILINNKVKKGQVFAVLIPGQGYTAELKGIGSEKSFVSDGTNYSGKYEVTNKIGNQVTVKITEGECSGSGWSTKYESTRTTVIDTATKITKFWGDVSGVNRDGKKYTISTSENTPVVKALDCKFVESGIQITKQEDKPEQTMDFSYAVDRKIGACDPLCLLKIGTIEYILDMSKTGKDAISLK